MIIFILYYRKRFHRVFKQHTINISAYFRPNKPSDYKLGITLKIPGINFRILSTLADYLHRKHGPVTINMLLQIQFVLRSVSYFYKLPWLDSLWFLFCRFLFLHVSKTWAKGFIFYFWAKSEYFFMYILNNVHY